jgi:lipopolysaccharide transport system ATP-binding protein
MGAISRLCHRAVWLDHGVVREIGETRSVVTSYLSDDDTTGDGGQLSFERDLGKSAQLRTVRLVDAVGNVTQSFDCDNEIVVELECEVARPVTPLYGCFEVWAGDGTQVMISYSYDLEPNPLEDVAPGLHLVRVVIPRRTLAAGSYRLHFSLVQGSGLVASTPLDSQLLCSFEVEDLTTLKGNKRLGFFSTLLPWTVSEAIGHSDGSARAPQTTLESDIERTKRRLLNN